jgi:hypothetical protein
VLYPKVASRLLWFPPDAYIYPQIAAGAGAIRQVMKNGELLDGDTLQ